MAAFSSSGFSAASFSPQAFSMDVATGRSGWARLQLIELQQKSLDEDERKKREQEQGQEAESGARKPETPKPVATPAKKPRRAAKPATVPEERTEPRVDRLPPLKRKPLYEAPEVLPTIWLISTELQTLVTNMRPVRQRMEPRIQEQQAANDDADVRLRLLLLAA